MNDPMLEEIWRVREELIKRHGGVHGYLRFLRELDRERVRKAKRRRARKGTTRAVSNGRVRQRRPAKV
jgi:hypothetical protein